MLWTAHHRGWVSVVAGLLLNGLIPGTGLAEPAAWHDPNLVADLSYGIYIFHFPILQGMIALKLFPPDGFQGLIVAAALVISAAFLSWHLIEKRWLQKSSHYVVAAHGHGA